MKSINGELFCLEEVKEREGGGEREKQNWFQKFEESWACSGLLRRAGSEPPVKTTGGWMLYYILEDCRLLESQGV